MYGSGLRLMEALRLRVKDLDFEHRAIMVRDGKGQKDRVVTLADELIVSLQRHLEGVRLIHTKDRADGFGEVVCRRWSKNTRRPDGNGADSARPVLRPAGASAPFLSRRNGGSMCSRPASAVSIPAPARNGAITSTRARCRRPSERLCAGPVSTNRPVAIPCAMRSRRTSWSGGWTSARCRTAWAQGRSNHTISPRTCSSRGISGPEPVGSGVGASRSGGGLNTPAYALRPFL